MSITIHNCHVTKVEKGADIIKPFPMRKILDDINSATNQWPRSATGGLFVPGIRANSIDWLDNSSALIGWLGTETGSPPVFKKSTGCHTPAEVFKELNRHAIKYEAVEQYPHEPQLKDHYYACEIPIPGDGKTLDRLLDRFEPESAIDRDLMKAAFVTPIWGGQGGARPILMPSSDAGRGAGKTTFTKSVGQLTGGTLELSMNEDESQIKTRLLSNEGLLKRCVVLDNVKSSNFSWGGLESLVTSAEISGKRMFHGEASRPNTLTWMITLNGVSLSKDIAQRSVVIKLAKPKRSGTWAEETWQFIENNRDKLIADIIGFLKSDRFELSRFSRWASWERDILQRFENCEEIQQTILDRQDIADVENEESGIVTEHFETELKRLEYSPDRQDIFIPSKICTEWFNAATGEREKTVRVSRKLNQLIGEGTLPRLERNRTNAYGRGFTWLGINTEIEDTTKTDIEERISATQNKQYF